MKSATPENLISTFKKTGIFPLNRDIIDSNIFAPAEVFPVGSTNSRPPSRSVQVTTRLPGDEKLGFEGEEFLLGY
jgi:hypothetical protein